MTHENMLLRPLPLLSRARKIELPHVPIVELADRTLRGISQVVFQNNLLSGLVILGAIAYNSGAYATSCMLGTVVATLTALLLRADRARPRRSGRRDHPGGELPALVSVSTAPLTMSADARGLAGPM